MELPSGSHEASVLWREKFSRQVLLPQVGQEGQRKWGQTPFLLAGDGEALGAAGEALAASGVSRFDLFAPDTFDSSPWTLRFPKLKVERQFPDNFDFSGAFPALVLAQDDSFRKKMSRRFRAGKGKALLGWTSGDTLLLYAYSSRFSEGGCPCVECLEALNPKAFAPSGPGIGKILGALAASEALLWALNGESPLEGKAWILSLSAGTSFLHEVRPTPKCPAALAQTRAAVTP